MLQNQFPFIIFLALSFFCSPKNLMNVLSTFASYSGIPLGHLLLEHKFKELNVMLCKNKYAIHAYTHGPVTGLALRLSGKIMVELRVPPSSSPLLPPPSSSLSKPM